MKSTANYATIMSVQGRHCLLIELKLRNVSTCIDDKTGGWEHGRPWISWEVLSRKKNPSPKSVWTAATLLFREERPFNADYFVSV